MAYITASAARVRAACLRANPNFRWDTELYYWLVLAALVTPVILVFE